MGFHQRLRQPRFNDSGSCIRAISRRAYHCGMKIAYIVTLLGIDGDTALVWKKTRSFSGQFYADRLATALEEWQKHSLDSKGFALWQSSSASLACFWKCWTWRASIECDEESPCSDEARIHGADVCITSLAGCLSSEDTTSSQLEAIFDYEPDSNIRTDMQIEFDGGLPTRRA